jgi:hypothetical protein
LATDFQPILDENNDDEKNDEKICAIAPGKIETAFVSARAGFEVNPSANTGESLICGKDCGKDCGKKALPSFASRSFPVNGNE